MVTTLKRWYSTYMCWRGSIRLNTLQKWLRHRFLFINFFWHLSNYTLLIYHLWTNVANWYKFSLRTSLFLFNSYVFFAGQPHNQYNELSQLRKIPFIEHTWSLKRTYSTNHMHQINCCDNHTVSCSSCVLHLNTTCLVAQRKHLTLQV